MKFRPAWILLIVLLPVSAAYSADPDWYVKKDTWQASMTASRDVLIALESSAAKTDKFQPYLSEVVQGSQPSQKVRVPVAGLKELYLIVTGVPDVTWGAANWADAKLINADGKETLVGHLPSLKVLEGRHSIDCNLDSGVSGPLKAFTSTPTANFASIWMVLGNGSKPTSALTIGWGNTGRSASVLPTPRGRLATTCGSCWRVISPRRNPDGKCVGNEKT